MFKNMGFTGGDVSQEQTLEREGFTTLEIGQRFVAPSGLIYKIAAFTEGDTVICSPVAFGHDAAVRYIEFDFSGIELVFVQGESPEFGKVDLPF